MYLLIAAPSQPAVYGPDERYGIPIPLAFTLPFFVICDPAFNAPLGIVTDGDIGRRSPAELGRPDRAESS